MDISCAGIGVLGVVAVNQHMPLCLLLSLRTVHCPDLLPLTITVSFTHVMLGRQIRSPIGGGFWAPNSASLTLGNLFLVLDFWGSPGHSSTSRPPLSLGPQCSEQTHLSLPSFTFLLCESLHRQWGNGNGA